VNAHFGAAVHGEVAVPDRLRETDATLDGTEVGVGTGIAGLPESTFADDLALHAADRVLVNAVAEVQEVDVESNSEFVNRLLKCKSPLRMAGSAERSRGTGVDEDVVLLGMQRSPLVKIGGGTGTAGSGAAAGCAEATDPALNNETICSQPHPMKYGSS